MMWTNFLLAELLTSEFAQIFMHADIPSRSPAPIPRYKFDAGGGSRGTKF